VLALKLGQDTVTVTKVEHKVPGMSVAPEPGRGAGSGHPCLICFPGLPFFLL